MKMSRLAIAKPKVLDWRPSHRDGFEFATEVDGGANRIRVNVRTVTKSPDDERQYAVRFVPYREYSSETRGDAVEECVAALEKKETACLPD